MLFNASSPSTHQILSFDSTVKKNSWGFQQLLQQPSRWIGHRISIEWRTSFPSARHNRRYPADLDSAERSLLAEIIAATCAWRVWQASIVHMERLGVVGSDLITRRWSREDFVGSTVIVNDDLATRSSHHTLEHLIPSQRERNSGVYCIHIDRFVWRCLCGHI